MITNARSDKEIQAAIQAEFKLNAHLQPYVLHVRVKNGIVTLSGQVDLHTQRLAAQITAHHFHDVQAVVNTIKVRFPFTVERSDGDLAAAAVQAIGQTLSIPANTLEVTVSNGIVTLTGEVDEGLQKRDAAWAIHLLVGVKDINNLIKVKHHLWPTDLKQNVEQALMRNAQAASDHITIEVQDHNRVIISGIVHSYMEKQVAENAIWSTPGVGTVDNNLVITHSL